MKNMKVTPELAEVCGIHAGDGYLRGGEKNRWELDISGNVEEKEYYDLHVKKLLKIIFGIKIHCRLFPARNTYGFVIRDKSIIKFMHDLGFPYGAKSISVKIPNKIMSSNDSNLLSRFLRGLFDTDGGVHFRKSYGKTYTEFKKTHNHYPIIRFTTISRQLYDHIKKSLEILGFGKVGEYSYIPKKPNENKVYEVTLYGPEKTERFFNIVSPKNPTKLSRFLLWKKIWHCPSHLTHAQRKEMFKKPVN